MSAGDERQAARMSPEKGSGALKIGPQGEREIVMTRTFNAPRRMVFDAMTKPELIKRWLLGPDGWTMPVCEVDLRVGGSYRWVWRHTDGKEMGVSGVYREVVPPERIAHTEKFDQPWYPGEVVITTVLTEEAGKTKFRSTILHVSAEGRESMLKSGMEKGVARSYDRLDEVLSTMQPA
jgi:uncharacterized protein YndB with AHSA1/START domain